MAPDFGKLSSFDLSLGSIFFMLEILVTSAVSITNTVVNENFELKYGCFFWRKNLIKLLPHIGTSM